MRRCSELPDENDIDQPKLMQLLKPCADYQDPISDFPYDDGGPDYDWGQTSMEYPEDLGVSFLEHLAEASEKSADEVLNIPDVDLASMNADQQFAFNIIMETVSSPLENETVKSLRLILSGTAGSGKSHLIKCVVKAVRQIYQYNKAAQVICPTANSANLISG